MFAEVDLPAQFRHLVGASVNVVQDEERTVGSGGRECPEPERSLPVNVAGDGFAVEDIVPVFPFDDLLRKNAVAVLCSGTQVFQPHAVER